MDVWFVEKIINYSNGTKTSNTIKTFSSLENAIEYIKNYDYSNSSEGVLYGKARDDSSCDQPKYYIRGIYPENNGVIKWLMLFVFKDPEKRAIAKFETDGSWNR